MLLISSNVKHQRAIERQCIIIQLTFLAVLGVVVSSISQCLQASVENHEEVR